MRRSSKRDAALELRTSSSHGLTGIRRAPSSSSSSFTSALRSALTSSSRRLLLLPLGLLAALTYYLLFSRPGLNHSSDIHHKFSRGLGELNGPQCSLQSHLNGNAVNTLLHGDDGSDALLRDGQLAPLRKRYIDALVCKGFCNQLSALADSMALAHLLNATLVLPSLYTGYSYKKMKGLSVHKAKHDLQAAERVPASEILDVQRLTDALKYYVEVVTELPSWLQGDLGFSRMTPHEVDPKLPHTLVDYRLRLDEHNVLRLGCMLHMVQWSTQPLRNLRSAFLGAIAPGTQVSGMVEAQVAKTGLQRGHFTFVHLRTEYDWRSYCKKEATRTEISQISSFEECYMTPRQVASYVAGTPALKEEPGAATLYVAGGEVTGRDLSLFRSQGFRNTLRGLSSPQEGSDESKRDLMAAAEWFVALDAAVVVGNIFSSFDWMLREARALRGAPTYYYNSPLHADQAHLQPLLHPLESLRWKVSPFPDYPTEPLSGICDVPRACSCKEAHSVALGEVHPLSTGGFIALKVAVNSHCRLCLFRIKIYADGELVAEEIANDVVRTDKDKDKGAAGTMEESPFHVILDVSVPVLVDEYQTLKLKACCSSTEDSLGDSSSSGSNSLCSEEIAVNHRPPLRNADLLSQHGAKPPPGRIFFHLPQRWETGGPEALHQLHHVINQLSVTGYLGLSSIFANGNPYYQTEFSNFTGLLVPWDLRPQDVLVMPEAYIGNTTSGMAEVANFVGALPVVWYLGQLSTSISTADKPGFRPLCLTDYFAMTEGCPPKAVINTPMGERFMVGAEEWRRDAAGGTQKEDLILYDPEESDMFDVDAIQLPPGATLVKLKGFNKQQVIDLYKRAKVIIDPFITGCERALFEGILFDVIPIVAYHGPARDPVSFPIPREWTWQLWDYDNLSSLVASALHDHSAAVEAFAPFLKHTVQLPKEFVKQTFDYFADDVLFVFAALCDRSSKQGCTTNNISSVEDRSAAFLAGAAALSSHPFADVEVIVENQRYAEFEFPGFLEAFASLGQSRAFRTTELEPEYRRFMSSAVLFQPPETIHRREYAVLMPPGAISLSPGLVAKMIREAREKGLRALRHAASGILLVEWWSYFGEIQRALPLLPDAASAGTVMAVLNDRLMTTGRGAADFSEELQHGVVRIGDDLRCLRPAHCRSLLEITRGALWRSSVSRIPYDDEPLAWFREAERHCESLTRRHLR